MSMTVAALHKRLGALIEAGHGRKPVLVNKASFSHPLEEDGAVMLDVAEVTQPRWIGMCDDDGGTKWNRDGTESGKTVVLLLGEHYAIVDIGMRMLTPRELYRAQGFPESYRIDRGGDGRILTKTAQVRMCGNSVCPPMAEAYVRANYRDQQPERMAA